MLPKTFDYRGCLDKDYEATLGEIRESILIRGPEPAKPDWDAPWRLTLLSNLEILARQLWNAGIETIYIDGSFVQNKSHPGDIDGCFACDFQDWQSGALEKRLNEAAPKKIWTWNAKDMRPVLGVMKYPMWASYRVELFPYSPEYATGILVDEELVQFPDAFRLMKLHTGSKGILKLKKD